MNLRVWAADWFAVVSDQSFGFGFGQKNHLRRNLRLRSKWAEAEGF